MRQWSKIKEWLAKHDVLTRAAALLAAIMIWFFVMDSENPDRDIEYRDIPVTLTGTSSIYNAYNLSVISGADTTVRVTVTGRNDQMIRLEQDQITASADISHITQPGTYTIPYEVSLPNNQVSVKSRNPSAIEVVVDRIVTQAVPVRVTVEGEKSDGYLYDTAHSSEETVMLTGPASQLEEVEYALVTLEADGWTEGRTVTVSYDLIDTEGEVYTSPHITRETETVNVTMTVRKIVTLPLTATLVDGGEITADMVRTTFSPETIQVAGPEFVVDRLDSIDVGEIDLTGARDGDQIEMVINSLPSTVILVNPEDNQVTVTLEIDEVTTRTISVTDFQIEDSTPDSGKSVELTSQSLSVVVRGRGSVLEDITAEDIIATIQVNSEWLEVGPHTVPVTLTTSDPERLTIVGEYSVLVNVTQ